VAKEYDMPIADPLRDPLYHTGVLIQQCDACRWAMRGHRSEYAECPQCGVPLPEHMALAFGGVIIYLKKRAFEVINTWGGPPVLYESDVVAIAQFLCRHAVDHRRSESDESQDARLYGPRRVEWRRDFRDHFASDE
jgi:hypothetical protein